MWANILLSVLLAAALCLKVNAHPEYQGYIPNGAIVPNPCNRSTIWPGVGHQAVYGAGARNPFGLDFAANDHVWNRTLCQKDSDGDGRTNGQELGDPNCNWTMGTTPQFSTNLSHPGVCEPLSAPGCLATNSFLMGCSDGKLDCPAINTSGVVNATLRFPMTPIPTKETTYICHRFNLPNNTVADIIAIEPVIDNARILHHMLLFACTDPPNDYPANDAFECGMAGGTSCRSLIGVWGVGGLGQCLYSQLGFRIGPGGFQYAILQLHWNNPLNTANLMDSSGMRIYYTTQLRPNKGQVAMMGQVYLAIPPRQPAVTYTGKCASPCTRHLTQSIFLTSAVLHMHTLGKSGDIRLSRNGQTIQVLDNVTQYDYNTPTFVAYDTPIEVKPGDEIQVKCVYDSTQKNATTYYGESTSDEMCYAFFAYYPLIDGLGFCGQVGKIDVCYGSYDDEFESCDFFTFTKLVSLLPYVCGQHCNSNNCSVLLEVILATGCQNYTDALVFISQSPGGSTFLTCGMGVPLNPQSTIQPPINQPTAPQCPQQPAASRSSGQAVSLYFCLIITIVIYAIIE